MNHFYRNIWNRHTGTWVAAAETARARSKRSGSVKLAALASFLLLAGWAHAQGVPSVTVSSGNTRAYVSPNGVTVVDIATTNAAGLSHNRYTQYNVNPSGLVLNNGNSDTMVRQSQLAGQVTANLNLNKEANVILNEVVANNRSTLAGFTEVLGGKADVVLANPYGITCNGCGFINTDRATLTTGVPTLNANGGLSGFDVNGGDVLITGNGLNASAQQVLDLVTRSARIESNINANDLSITTGANHWDYGSRSATATLTPAGATPAYAIDSSALGGMYANRIRLDATEAGVGVRMLGDAASGVGDFTLSAAGKIELKNSISAQGNIHVQNTDTGADALTLTNASLASTGATALASSGGTQLNGGAIVAGSDLSVTAASLIDQATSSSVVNNNQRHAGGALGLNVAGNTQVAGTEWGSAGNWNGSFGSLAGGANTLLYSSGGTLVASADNGNLALGAAALRSAGNLTLAASGEISTASGPNQGVESSGGNISVTAGSGLDNAGVISADTGSITVHAGALGNTGAINAGQAVDIADAAGGATQTVNNQGKVLAGQDLKLQGQDVTNGGWLQAGGSDTVSADSLSNSGTIVALGGDTQLRVDQSVTNTGKIQSANNVALSSRSSGASTELVNSGEIRALNDISLNAATLNNSNVIVAGGAALLTASTLNNSGNAYAQGNLSVATGALNNTGGVLEAGGQLGIGASDAIGNATDAVMTGGSVDLNGAQGLDNQGLIYASSGDAKLHVSGTLKNNGQIQTAGKLDLADKDGNSSETVTNDGSIQADGNSTVKAASVTNDGTWLLSTQAGSPASSITVDGQLVNGKDAVLQAYTDATVSAAGVDNQAGGLIRTGGSLSIAASGTTDISNAGTLQAGNTLTLSGSGALDNASGALALGDSLQVAVGSLDNSGTLQGGSSTSTSVTASGKLTNEAGGVITVASAATGGGTVGGGTIANQGTIQSLGNLALDVGSGGLTNTGDGTTNGRIVADGNTTIQAGGSNSYVATIGGTLQSGSTLAVIGDSGSSLDIQGTARGATTNVAIGKVNVGATGVLAANGDMGLTTDKLTLGASGTGSTAKTGRVLAALSGSGKGTVKVGTDLSNSGLIFSGNDLEVDAPNIEVGTTGALSALNDLTLRAAAAPLDLSSAAPATGKIANGGLLYAGNTISAEGNQIVNGALADGTVVGDAQINSEGSATLRANTLVNNAAINATNDINIVATTFRNEVAGGDTRQWIQDPNSATKEIASQDDGGAGGNLDKAWEYQYTYKKYQQYQTALPSLVPQITAGNNLNIAFHDAKNLAATLYAGNAITLQGFSYDSNQKDGSLYASLGISDAANHGFKLDGATFVNDNLALETQNHTVTYSETTKYVALGPDTKYSHELCSTASGGHWDSVCYTDGINDTYASTWNNPANAGLYSKKLTGSGFALTNNGATGNSSQTVDTSATDLSSGLTGKSPDKTPTGLSRDLGEALSSVSVVKQRSPGVLTARGASSYTPGQALASYLADNAANGVNGTAFGGINITLPRNPNGLFVLTPDPGAAYLVETNPLYLSGGSSVGSDYLARLLGYNPDQIGLRLGDDSYEAWLVKQELIKQTGSAVLASYQNADSQMKGLMDHAASESGALGLVYGKALTPAQQAKLKEDIVWMVQTEIDGKTVLAPVVYLAQSTREHIATGAVISAQDANLSVASLTNTGGTLIGSNSLVVASAGDISNLSGLIKGGNVNLSSSEGSIINKTLSEGSGGKSFYTTQLDKTASIESTGNLSLDAKQDITNLGANVAAGGDASLKAGGDITFDTIQDKETNTTSGTVKHGFSTTTTSTTTQVKSGLNVGGNLDAAAGNDITLAGTDTKVGGNAALDAGHDVNIVARENTSQTHSETHVAGYGVNNSLYGTTTTTTDSKSGRNVGSNFDVGGDANLKAGNDVTIQGSNVDVKGSGKIDAKNVNVLAGQNYDESTTTTKQTGILQVSASSDKSANADASASATTKGATASAGADAGASASGTGSAGLAFSSTTTTTDKSTDLKHVGSNVHFGGDLDVNATNDVTLQGSTLGGKNTTVTAKDVNVLAAEDKSTSSHSVSTTKVGLLTSTTNTAGASAGAKAGASGSGGLPSANADAEANASVSSENRIDFVQTSKSETDTLDTTHQGSGIVASGNLTIKSDKLNVEGSSLHSDGDMTLDAKDQTFGAVNDRHETRTSSSATSAGIYVDAGASASASANGQAGVGGAQGGASASANASAEGGVYGSNTRSNSVEGSTTARTSSISTGGNLTRNAENSITDVGTQIDVGGDLNQSAKTITSQQAENTTYSSSSTATDTAKVGAYADAGVSAEATANFGNGASKSKKVGSDTGAGIRASYQHDDESSRSATSTAVVSNIHVGGSVHSTSTGATILQGTQITAGKDVDLQGGSIDYSAAKNTSSSSTHSTSAGGSVGVDLVNKSVSVGANYSGGKSSEQSSTAVVGGITAGGNVNVKSSGDTRFEGTNIAAGDGTNITTGGTLKFDAAKNTSQSSSQSADVNVDVTVGKKQGSGSAGVDYSKSSSSHDEDVAGSISSGAGGIHINAGKDATFTGTNLDSTGGDVAVAAGGNLVFNAAHTVDHSESTGVGVAAAGSAGEKKNVGGTRTGGMFSNKKTGGHTMNERSGAGSVSVGTSKSDSNVATGSGIHSNGGNITLSSGGNTTLEGTQVAAGNNGSVTVAAGGDVIQKAAVSTSSSSGVAFAASGAGSSLTPAKGKGGTGTTSGTSKTGSGTGTGAGGTSGAGTNKGGAGTGSTGKTGATTGGSGATGASGKASSGTTGTAKAPKTAEELTQKKGSGIVTLGVENKSKTKSTETTLSGGQGVTIVSGKNNAAAQQVSISIPVANMPEGKAVQAKTADGKPLPSWLKLDPKTGKITGKPPADFKGELKLDVSVPQPDGSVRTVPVTINGGN